MPCAMVNGFTPRKIASRRCSIRKSLACWGSRSLFEPVPIPVLAADERYQHYISPIEALALGDQDLEEIGPKEILRAKRTLLHEIELEGGKISWMEGVLIDRSRALAICDEITTDSEKLWFHNLVHTDTRLLGFLSRGELEHFLVHPDDEERVTEVAMRDNAEDGFGAGFGAWLSPIFAAQFNLVLAKAISQKDLKVVECLLGGRRWVQPKDEDACFVLARRIVSRLIEELEVVCKRAEKERLRPEQLKEALARDHLGKLLEMLPSTFSEEREKTFFLVRGVAIDTNNVHDDYKLALDHLELARPLAKKSPQLKHKLDADATTLKTNKAEQDKHACRLTWGDKPLEIAHAGARHGDIVIPADQVSSLKWGATSNAGGRRGMARYQLSIFGASGKEITVDWTTQESKEQDDYFGRLTYAALVYLMDPCIINLRKSLASGKRFGIGEAVATQAGLKVKIDGWFSSKDHTIAWDHLKGAMHAGIITLTDRTNSKATVAMSAKDIDNAVTLYWMAKRDKDH